LNSFYFLNSLWRNLERFISLFGLILWHNHLCNCKCWE
jgi:hypothetical protein